MEEVASKPAPKKKARPGVLVVRRRKIRRFMRLSFFPIVLTVLILGIMVLALLPRLPTYGQGGLDPRVYRAGIRLSICFGFTMVLQQVLNWYQGLIASREGTHLATATGENLKSRLRVVRKRLRLSLALTLMSRFLVMFVVIVASIFVYSSFFGARATNWDFFQWIKVVAKRWPFFVNLVVVFGGLHWFVGPVLRQRYSILLGGLSASFSPNYEDRGTFASGARVGLGLAHGLIILWGGAILILLILTIQDPNYLDYSYNSSYNFDLTPSWSNSDAWKILRLEAILLTVWYSLHVIGQIVLPFFYRTLLVFRLKRKTNH